MMEDERFGSRPECVPVSRDTRIHTLPQVQEPAFGELTRIGLVGDACAFLNKMILERCASVPLGRDIWATL